MGGSELKTAGRDYVSLLKLSGMKNSDIASLLVYAIAAVACDDDTPPDMLTVLNSMFRIPKGLVP